MVDITPSLFNSLRHLMTNIDIDGLYKKYKNMYEFYKSTYKIRLEDVEWINEKNIDKINDFIEKKNKDNTKKVYFSLIATIVKKFNLSKKIYDKFSQKSTNLHIKWTKFEKKNILTDDKEKYFMKYEDIRKIADSLKNEKDKIEHFKYLILSLYTLTPPIRSEYIYMPYLDEKNENINQIYKKNDNLYLYIIVDKVKFAYTPLEYKLPENLEKIIKSSFNLYPRKYILPFSYKTLYRYLKDMNLSINSIRSSYISHFYNKLMSIEDKEKLAAKMRHSIEIASLTYHKLPTCEKKKEICEINQKTLTQLQKYKFAKENIYKHVQKSKQEMAIDYIKKLNNKFIKNPRKITLDKYNIIKKNDVYVFKNIIQN